MTEIVVQFMHPTNGKVISVGVDETMTGQEVISELITNNFVPPSNDGYNLAIKGGAQLDNKKTLYENGVKENDTLKVIPATNAGYK